jgi:hypothetical protein
MKSSDRSTGGLMNEAPDSPPRAAGWYPDPERAHTLRYWDGDAWTDDRAPDVPSTPSEAPPARSPGGWTGEDGGLSPQSRYAVGIGLAAIGALIAIVGVFLPLADTESSLHLAKNSLIQHWEGPVVIAVALGGLLAALHPKTRPLTFLAGGALVLLAVVGGTSLPIEYRNQLSRAVAGDASPGAGIWTVGVGGAILALSALFGDWSAFSDGSDAVERRGHRSRMERFEEVMSGRPAGEDVAGDSEDAEPIEPMEPEAPEPRRKGQRMRRFEELMSGRPIPDPEADPDEAPSPDSAER